MIINWREGTVHYKGTLVDAPPPYAVYITDAAGKKYDGYIFYANLDTGEMRRWDGIPMKNEKPPLTEFGVPPLSVHKDSTGEKVLWGESAVPDTLHTVE